MLQEVGGFQYLSSMLISQHKFLDYGAYDRTTFLSRTPLKHKSVYRMCSLLKDIMTVQDKVSYNNNYYYYCMIYSSSNRPLTHIDNNNAKPPEKIVVGLSLSPQVKLKKIVLSQMWDVESLAQKHTRTRQYLYSRK